VGVVSWDPHGNQPKFAEDWQQNDNFIFNGLFGYKTVLGNGRNIIARGYGESDGTSTATRITLTTVKPGKCRAAIEFRSATNFYDITSEMRSHNFSMPPAPPVLTEQPALDWRLAKVRYARNLGKGYKVSLGFNQLHKQGSKNSLLRGANGNAAPGIKLFDNTTNEFLLGVGYQGTNLEVNANGLFRQSDNNRAVGLHTYTEDHTYYRASLAATYRFSDKTNLLGSLTTGKLETDNQEGFDGQTYSPSGESTTMNGRLAFITRLGPATTTRVTAGFGTWNTDYQTDLAGIIEQATNRERASFDAGLLVTNTSLKKTRLRFDYRFRGTKLEDSVAMNNLPGSITEGNQIIDQDRMSQRASLKMTTRVGRKTSLKARLDWRSLFVDQTNSWSGSELFYTMGDRTQNRFGGRLAVQTRPSGKVRLNLGVQAHAQNFERDDVENVKTTNSATQGFVGLNFLANDRLTFLGTGSYGIEKFEVENGPVAGSSMGPLTYEGKTLRFAPGVIFQLMDKMQLEAHYEGVRFEDPGDAPDEANQLNSDLDRILARASYQVSEAMKVTATYRRHEFDENRWDDYIMDLYSLSLSGKF